MHPTGRATFEGPELSIVLSHYDLGVIESITDLARGSSRSPKAGIVADRGKFVLKRRVPHRSHSDRVTFGHRVQRELESAGYPAPKLIATRNGRGRAVRFREHVYELFEFISGQPFSRLATEAFDAGRLLARFHEVTDSIDLQTLVCPVTGEYHDSVPVRAGLGAVGPTLHGHESYAGKEAELAGLIQFLLDEYDRLVDTVNSLGYSSWPVRVVHGDWHPGNLLFRNGQVVAVVDYESVRCSRAMTDVANGALHFSITSGGAPSEWPEHADQERFQSFLRGYESLRAISPAERSSLPSLMGEALIAECVPPPRAEGSPVRWTGFRVLQMAKRKAAWLARYGTDLLKTAAE